MALGPAPLFSLHEARAKALRARLERYEGRDPLGDRLIARPVMRAPKLTRERGKSSTFSECARAYIAAHRPSWRAARYGRLWETSLATYAEPVIGALPVSAIETDHVLQVLQPVWSEMRTAMVLRGRIESVLDWAKAKGYRTGDNPARWKGHLENLLHRPTRQAGHFAALPYSEVAAFIAKLRSCKDQTTARAYEFVILTAARSAEVFGAVWTEIDMEARLWVIPAARMKAEREHRVPLSEPAMAILRHQMTTRAGGQHYVFPGKKGSRMGDKMMRDLTYKLGYQDRATVHGFRSSFRDWAGDCTDVAREVVEAALAHAVGDKTEQSYRRGDALAKRRALMDEWAKYLNEHIPEEPSLRSRSRPRSWVRSRTWHRRPVRPPPRPRGRDPAHLLDRQRLGRFHRRQRHDRARHHCLLHGFEAGGTAII
jgi:integrase